MVQERDREPWFRAPRDVGEAIAALSGGGRVLAGGTDLVLRVNLGGERPERVVWIGGLGLDGIEEDGEVLRIGAGVSLATIAADPMIRAFAAALAAAAGKLAGPAVRNLATIGGSLCAAWRRSDIGCAVLGLDGELVAVGPGGERRIPMTDFYAHPRGTTIAPDELLTHVRIPRRARSGFAKIGRRAAFTLPVVNAAACAELGDDRVVSQAVVAVGVGALPERAPSVERALIGRVLDPPAARDAAAHVLDDVTPANDQQATSWYRERVAPIAVARALLSAAEEGGSR